MDQPDRKTPHDGDTEQTILFERSPLSVPLNLGEWLAPELLAKWVSEVVAGLDSSKPEVLNFLRQPASERPEVILKVLLFSYATQRYISSEVFRACHSDPVLGEMCGNKAPFADELEHFRRRNRLLIENLLGQLLVRAVKERFVQQGQLPPGLQHSLFGRAVDRVDAARHLSAWDDADG